MNKIKPIIAATPDDLAGAIGLATATVEPSGRFLWLCLYAALSDLTTVTRIR